MGPNPRKSKRAAADHYEQKKTTTNEQVRSKGQRLALSSMGRCRSMSYNIDGFCCLEGKMQKRVIERAVLQESY